MWSRFSPSVTPKTSTAPFPGDVSPSPSPSPSPSAGLPWRPSIYRGWLSDAATYPLLCAVIFGGTLLIATLIRKTSAALDERNADLTMDEAEVEKRFRESLVSREVVKASSPVRSAASSLLLNPYHAPPPVPPPPHPPGEESDEAHLREEQTLTSASDRPPQAMAFPLPCLWLSQVLERGKDVLSLLFPHTFSELEEEMKGTGTLEGGGPSSSLDSSPSPPLLPPPQSHFSVLPGCCQSSYRALFMSVLLPFLPISSQSPPPPPSSSSSPSFDSAKRPPSPSFCSSSSPPLPSTLLLVHPEAHPEVLFDCPVEYHVNATEDADGALEWPSKHLSDEEDDGQLYFHHIYERYLAMAEDLSW